MLDPPPGDPKNRSFWTVLPLEIAILGVKKPIFRACGAPKITDLPLEIAILGPQKTIFFRPVHFCYTTLGPLRIHRA